MGIDVPPRPAGRRVSAEVRQEVEEFVYAEADLLDTWQIEEWLTLFTDDCRYWVPANADDQDPETETSLAYDDHLGLEDRVLRLLSPAAHSQTPRSRTRRVIGNVRVDAGDGDDVRVTANFIVHEARLNRERVFAGRYEYILRREADTWRIHRKKAALVNNNVPLHNLTILL
jgi:benzoate/toluate 1,2-dioxygenase beta subunit